MIKIAIAQRFMPFSHRPGAICLIPGTCVEMQAFPTLLRIGGIELRLQITGPVKGFTLQQDLERDCIWVFGKAAEGYFRLKVRRIEEGIEVCALKGQILAGKSALCIPMKLERQETKPMEKLSLGSHRKQDWDLVWRRFDLREILPILYLLAQKVPAQGEAKGPVAQLLKRSESLKGWEAFCCAGFSELLLPQLTDVYHQGLCLQGTAEGDRYALFRAAFQPLRALFFQAEGQKIVLLPHPLFDAGRLINLQAPGIGEWDLEWTKGSLRRVIVRAEKTGEIEIQLQKGLKSFRMRTSEKEKGKRMGGRLYLEAGKQYLLDRFQS